MALQWDVLRGLAEMYGGDRRALREFLLRYYSTQSGKEALDGSPHRGRPIESYVEDLLDRVEEQMG